jgi:hypothetical protein
VVVPDRCEGPGLAGAAPLVDHTARDGSVMVAVPATEPGVLGCAFDELGAVLPHGHQLPVADPLAIPLDVED